MKTRTRTNRVLNDLAEANFNTPPDFEFIRYGRRADADYKVSKDPQGIHLIEIRRGEEYLVKKTPDWAAAQRHLAYLCSKFRTERLLSEAKEEMKNEFITDRLSLHDVGVNHAGI